MEAEQDGVAAPALPPFPLPQPVAAVGKKQQKGLLKWKQCLRSTIILDYFHSCTGLSESCCQVFRLGLNPQQVSSSGSNGTEEVVSKRKRAPAAGSFWLLTQLFMGLVQGHCWAPLPLRGQHGAAARLPRVCFFFGGGGGGGSGSGLQLSSLRLSTALGCPQLPRGGFVGAVVCPAPSSCRA